MRWELRNYMCQLKKEQKVNKRKGEKEKERKSLSNWIYLGTIIILSESFYRSSFVKEYIFRTRQFQCSYVMTFKGESKWLSLAE